MTRALWILAVITLAVRLALPVFGGRLVRALMAPGWSVLLLTTTLDLALNALVVVTAVAGVYVAGKAHRGGWVALFGVALVLGLYGPTAATAVVPHLTFGRAALAFLQVLDLVLDALVPVVALTYALYYRPRRGAPALSPVDGA